MDVKEFFEYAEKMCNNHDGSCGSCDFTTMCGNTFDTIHPKSVEKAVKAIEYQKEKEQVAKQKTCTHDFISVTCHNHTEMVCTTCGFSYED